MRQPAAYTEEELNIEITKKGLRFDYPTGRDYGRPQVLDILITDCAFDEFNLLSCKAFFTDRARSFRGAVTLTMVYPHSEDIGRAVLREYDEGRTSYVSVREIREMTQGIEVEGERLST